MRFVLVLAVLAAVACARDPIIVPRSMISRALSGHAMASPLANMTVEFEETLFTKINALLLPIINNAVASVTIQGQTQTHFSFNTFTLTGDLGGISLDFSPPNLLIFTMDNFNMNVPTTDFCVMDKILFIHLKCCGTMTASISGTTVVMNMDISNVGGVLQVANAGSSVTFGSVSVSHNFPGFFCKIGNDIIQLFIGNLNNLIENAVETQVPQVVCPAIISGVNGIFSALPFVFLNQPTVKTSSVEVIVEINWKTGSFEDRKAHGIVSRKKGPLPVITDHDIDMYVSGASLDEIFSEWTTLGVLDGRIPTPPSINTTALKALIPAAYTACPGCPFEVGFTPVQPPKITFVGDSIHVDVRNAKSDFNAMNANGAKVPLVDLIFNATVEMNSFVVTGTNGNTIMFTLAIPTLAFNVASSSIGPVSGQYLTSVLNLIVNDVFLPGFNKNFPGLTFPTIDGAGIGSLVLDIGNNNFAVGADVTLPS